jgi:hypothetical protein
LCPRCHWMTPFARDNSNLHVTYSTWLKRCVKDRLAPLALDFQGSGPNSPPLYAIVLYCLKLKNGLKLFLLEHLCVFKCSFYKFPSVLVRPSSMDISWRCICLKIWLLIQEKSLSIVHLTMAHSVCPIFLLLKNFLYNEKHLELLFCPNMYEQCWWDVIKS